MGALSESQERPDQSRAAEALRRVRSDLGNKGSCIATRLMIGFAKARFASRRRAHWSVLAGAMRKRCDLVDGEVAEVQADPNQGDRERFERFWRNASGVVDRPRKTVGNGWFCVLAGASPSMI